MRLPIASASATGVRGWERSLKPGAYRVVVTASDAAGNTSAPVRKTFRIVARG